MVGSVRCFPNIRPFNQCMETHVDRMVSNHWNWKRTLIYTIQKLKSLYADGNYCVVYPETNRIVYTEIFILIHLIYRYFIHTRILSWDHKKNVYMGNGSQIFTCTVKVVQGSHERHQHWNCVNSTLIFSFSTSFLAIHIESI